MMFADSWTWRVGSLGGVPLRVHWLTVAITLSLLGFGASREGSSGAWEMAGLLGLAFSAVVGHEWAHAWAARRCGLPVQAVQIGPLLNAAYLRRAPDRPLDEVAVAAAGPAFNALLAGCLALGVLLSPDPPGELTLACWINLVMAGGNLVPIFPLDGARVLRGLLGLRLPWLAATRSTLKVGNLLLAAGAGGSLALLREQPVWLALSLLVAGALYRSGRRCSRQAWTRERRLRATAEVRGGWRSSQPT